MADECGNSAGRLEKCFRDCFESRTHSPEAAIACWSEQKTVHLPLTLDVLKASAQSCRPYATQNSKRALLLTIGYSDDQLALVIALHRDLWQVSKVVPFASWDTWNDADGVEGMKTRIGKALQALGWKDQAVDDLWAGLISIPPSDPVDVFRKVAGAAREWRSKGYEVAIDCTGGKKPTDSGAAHAASFYGVSAFYLDFERYSATHRRPLPWTLKYTQLRQPDSSLALSGRGEIFSLFKAGRFVLAYERVEAISAGTGMDWDPELKEGILAAKVLARQASDWLRSDYQSGDPALRHLHSVHWEKFVATVLSDGDGLCIFVADELWRAELEYEQTGDCRGVIVSCSGIVELVLAYLAGPGVVKERPTRSDLKRQAKKRVSDPTFTNKRFKYPSSVWALARNKIAHHRAIVDDKQLADEAFAETMRWIELLFRVVGKQDTRAIGVGDQGITWHQDSRMKRATRCPWREAACLEELRRLLQLPALS